MQPQQPIVELEVDPDAVADWFYPLLKNRDRYLLLWGGRDSTKSDGVALKLLLDCLALPYFKCLLLRKVADTVAGSQWATLKAVAEREGIDHLFFFGISPCVIKCLENGNVFLARGLDKPKKLKSTKDPTCAWFEEGNEASENDAEIVSTTLRTSRPGTVIQEIYTFNPDHEGDYKEFWLYKKFFSATGHASELSFSGSLDTELDGETVRLPYTVAHATIRDNPWAPKERIAKYKSYEFTDPYRYRIWYQGLWATKQTGNEFYPMFKRGQHTGPVPFMPGLPIWQSWDANSLPYCAMFCAQHEDLRHLPDGKRTLRIFREYAIGSPNSGLRNTGHAFLKDRRARGWQDSAVMLTGDASLKARKPSDERSTAYDDVLAALSGFTDTDGQPVPGCLNGRSGSFWPRRNPEVERRRDFVNYLLAGGFPGIAVLIDATACPNLIADMELTQKGVDGKLKEMYNDTVLGVRYQIRGHFSDTFDYLVTTILSPEYEAFKAGRGG